MRLVLWQEEKETFWRFNVYSPTSSDIEELREFLRTTCEKRSDYSLRKNDATWSGDYVGKITSEVLAVMFKLRYM